MARRRHCISGGEVPSLRVCRGSRKGMEREGESCLGWGGCARILERSVGSCVQKFRESVAAETEQPGRGSIPDRQEPECPGCQIQQS